MSSPQSLCVAEKDLLMTTSAEGHCPMCHPTIIQQGARRRDGLHLSKLESKMLGQHTEAVELQSWTLHSMFQSQFFHLRCVKYIAIHVKAICVPQLFMAWTMWHPNHFKMVIHNMQTCGELYVRTSIYVEGKFSYIICIVHRIVYSHIYVIYVYKLPLCPVVVVVNHSIDQNS